MTGRRLGLLGGTFDPIHCGHIDAARAAESALHLNEVLIIPSNVPPHRHQPAASAGDRCAMAALAAEGVSHWRVSEIELRDPSRSYTWTTLRRMHEQGWQPSELFFVMGADAFVEIESWKNFPEILDQAHFAVVSRPGVSVTALADRLPTLAARMIDSGAFEGQPGRTVLILIDAPTADVSSTAIRQRLAAGESIAGMVPAAVANYIEKHHLYARTEPPAGAERPAAESKAGRLHGED